MTDATMAELSLDQGLTALLRGDARLTRDPYPFYGRLRDEAPVHRLGSFVFVSTHAEAKAAFLDNQRLVNKPHEPVSPSAALSFLSATEKEMYNELLQFELGCISRKDGLDHTRVRAVVQPAFARPHVAELTASKHPQCVGGSGEVGRRRTGVGTATSAPGEERGQEQQHSREGSQHCPTPHPAGVPNVHTLIKSH